MIVVSFNSTFNCGISRLYEYVLIVYIIAHVAVINVVVLMNNLVEDLLDKVY